MSSFRYLHPHGRRPSPPHSRFPFPIRKRSTLRFSIWSGGSGERNRETPFPRNDISKRNPGRSRAYSSRNGKGCTRRAPEGLRGYNEI